MFHQVSKLAVQSNSGAEHEKGQLRIQRQTLPHTEEEYKSK